MADVTLLVSIKGWSRPPSPATWTRTIADTERAVEAIDADGGLVVTALPFEPPAHATDNTSIAVASRQSLRSDLDAHVLRIADAANLVLPAARERAAAVVFDVDDEDEIDLREPQELGP